MLETLGQSASVHFTDISALRPSAVDLPVLLPVMVLSKGNGSCLFAATEQCSASLSISALTEVCNHVLCMVYSESPDTCSANVRKTCEAAARLPANCLCSAPPCAAHQAHRTVVTASSEESIIGDVHSVAVSCSTSIHQPRMLNALRDLVETEMDIIYTHLDTASRRGAMRSRSCRGHCFGKMTMSAVVSRMELSRWGGGGGGSALPD